MQDFGCGIPPDRINTLFVNFNKIDEHQKRNKFGVGLGLSICKSLIEQMAGHVDVQSEVGKGTKFIINFKTVCQVSSERSFIEFRKQPRFVDEQESIKNCQNKLAVIGSLIKSRANPRKKKSVQSISHPSYVEFASHQLQRSHDAPSNINLSQDTIQE